MRSDTIANKYEMEDLTDEHSLQSKTVRELKNILIDLGCQISGSKPVLIRKVAAVGGFNLSEEELNDKNVSELKVFCKGLTMPCGGKKEELIRRLLILHKREEISDSTSEDDGRLGEKVTKKKKEKKGDLGYGVDETGNPLCY